MATQPDLAVSTSQALFSRAERLIPGGVNSPVRAFRAVGGTPRFVERALGSRVWDVDGHVLIDYIGSWGALLFGHAFPPVVRAIGEQAARGTTYGAPTRLEVEMAETLTRLVPSLEMVRMVNSGTEATMSAVRVARGATGRPKLLKFEGCYHGHGDGFLVKAGSGAATFGTPDSPGVTQATAQDTVTVPYNDIAAVEAAFDAHPGRFAAIIVEPVVGNMGVVQPGEGFLEGLREICTRSGALLVFDEVMTGFRVARGGAQEKYGIEPDLTTLGKIIGGGLPVGAFGGRRDVMQQVSPSGPIYQAGTLSGNPLAMTAGLITLATIEQEAALYATLEGLGARLEAGLGRAFTQGGIPARIARVGSMWTPFFTSGDVTDWAGASGCNREHYGRFFHHMLSSGILLAPSQFEANFISAAHSEADIDATIAAALSFTL